MICSSDKVFVCAHILDTGIVPDYEYMMMNKDVPFCSVPFQCLSISSDKSHLVFTLGGFPGLRRRMYGRQ